MRFSIHPGLRRLPASILVVLAACEVPDRPPALPEPLPEAVEAFLAPDTSRVLRVADGVVYRYLWSPRGPWAVHLVEADLARCPLGVEVVAAPVQEGLRGGLAPVTELLDGYGPAGLVAVNGDFFTPEGMPTGPEVVRGERRRDRERPAAVFRGGADLPWIGTTGVSEGEVVVPAWPLGDAGPASVQVVGGYPELLDAGAPVGDLGVADNPGFAASRHPRTAVAVSTDDQRLWFVVVDGRLGDFSTGMTLPELTELLTALGAEEALNLDGGGSSVMVVRGRTVSHPSDEQGERPVVNALILAEDPAFCRRPGSAR